VDPRVVVVHRGARDSYEVAAGLAGAGMLERLVTDLYWPHERAWVQRLEGWLPPRLTRNLEKRSHVKVPGSAVLQTPAAGLSSFLLEKLKQLPFALRRGAVRYTDAQLGRKAGRLARRKHALLLSYSYYGYDAFRAYGAPGMLFQLHPHPLSVRRILQQELQDHPDCAESLKQEWELALPEEDFRRLVWEAEHARYFLVASSFTRHTLIEHGADPETIRVIPYGVDLARFQPPERQQRAAGPLRLLFVGTVNQRKGIKYLLEALRLLGRAPLELTVCGRIVDDLSLFRPLADRVRVQPFVRFPELQELYRAADLFVLPSVAEGFAHVLLEALASGLPILSTTHTAAPDLITPGEQGFVVEPRRADQVASWIDWALSHRHELESMKRAARERAEHFTWQRFREGVVEAVSSFAAPTPDHGSFSRVGR
jgi:glycosyltransferase involved in cell wall biosynthesis